MIEHITDILFETFIKNKDPKSDLYLVEGLIVDEKRKVLKLTDQNNDGVNFSNPTYLEYKYRFDNDVIDVISIFKRTALAGQYKEIDGNPFVYALKNKENNPNDWRFDITKQEIYKYIRRFLEVCHSIDKEYDTIIMVPSSHEINKNFMRAIFECTKAKNKVEDLFFKTFKAEAYDSRNLDAIWKYCQKKHPGNYNAASRLEDSIINRLEDCFHNMKGDYFQASKVDKEYLKFIDQIVMPNNDYTVEQASELIRDKRVLVLDDVLSTGATISACVKHIKLFGPKKLQVITLLSNKRK